MNDYQTSPPSQNYQTYSDPYGYTSSSHQLTGAEAGVLLVVIMLYFVVIATVVILSAVGMWKAFTKAGKPGWAAIVPIYNTIVMCEIAGAPLWWVIMLFVPLANIVFMVMLTYYFVKSYGKDTGFAVLTIFFPAIMYPVLGFSKAHYVGPAYLAANPTAGQGYP